MATNQSARRGGIAVMSAGGLVAVALVGPAAWDGLWLALAPAAALVILAARELHAAWRPRDGRLGAVGTLVLTTGAGALLALMVIGTVATATLGLEPAWLAFPEEVAGYAFLAGAALFGLAALWTQTRPRTPSGRMSLNRGQSRNAFRNVLKPVLDTAVDSGYLPANLAVGVKLPRSTHEEMRFLTVAQVEALAEEIDEPHGPLVLFAAYSGLRAGEIGVLRIKKPRSHEDARDGQGVRRRSTRPGNRLRADEDIREAHADDVQFPPGSSHGLRRATLRRPERLRLRRRER
jgi:hypothetical protein